MTCCGGKRRKPITEEDRVKRLRTYLEVLRKRNKCSNCGGVLRKYPNSVIMCINCRKRIN